MSLQWTAVATFLYAEVFLVLLLCVPFVSAARWQKIFKSRLVGLAVAYGNTVFVVLIVILILLLFVLGRAGGGGRGLRSPADPFSRSLLRRLVTLISQQAVLGASSEAFRKQAEGASQAARRYMEDNDALRKV
ncbi:B-cell receptor-associated protein 31, partial [Spheniscus humboldti]